MSTVKGSWMLTSTDCSIPTTSDSKRLRRLFTAPLRERERRRSICFGANAYNAFLTCSSRIPFSSTQIPPNSQAVIVRSTSGEDAPQFTFPDSDLPEQFPNVGVDLSACHHALRNVCCFFFFSSALRALRYASTSELSPNQSSVVYVSLGTGTNRYKCLSSTSAPTK